MTPKIISYDVEIKSTSKLWVQKVPEVYTNDSNSVEIQFNLIDCTEAELLNSTAQVLLYMRDGSFFQNTGVDVVRTGTTFSYTLKDNEGNHQGLTEVQLVLTIVGTPNEDYASQMYQFKIKNGLGNNVPVETFIQTWETLTTEANAFIAQMETDVQEFDVALESGVLATNIAAKLTDLETTYAPDLLSVKQQLEHAETYKVGDGVLATMADLGQDVKTALTGGSVAVVGNFAVNENNMGINLFNNLGTFTKAAYALQTGYYSQYDIAIVYNTNYKSLYVACLPNEMYNCDTYVSGSTYSIVQFYRADGSLLSRLTGIGLFTNYTFVVPADAAFLSVTTATANLAIPVLRKYAIDIKSKVTAAETSVSGVRDLLADYVARAAASTLANTVYSAAFPGGTTLSGFTAYNYDVTAGETLYVTTNVYTNEFWCIAIFYNATNNVISYIGQANYGYHEKYAVVVPEGATKMIISTQNSVITPTVHKKEIAFTDISTLIKDKATHPTYVKKIGDRIEVMFKYDAGNDMIIVFDKCGVNLLMAMHYFYLIPNTDKNCSGDFSKARTLFRESSTDWVGPYKVQAVSNVDGNGAGAGNYFTGGWHAFDNTGAGVATARNVSYALYADDSLVSADGTIGCDAIKIVVINNIQGNNTTKADGTGREILQEKVTYTIKENTVDVVNIITALEQVTITTYYGIQIDAGNKWSTSVSYFGNKILDYTFAAAHDIADCDYIVAKSAASDIATAYMRAVGLGKFANSGSIRAFNTTYSKAYFNLIATTAPIGLLANEKIFFNGGYLFTKDVLRLG